MAQHRHTPRQDELGERAANFPAADISRHTREIQKIRKERRAAYTVPGTNEPANEAYTFIAKAFEATGDPIFGDALSALASYGLAGKRAERRFDSIHEQMNFGPLVRQVLSVARANGEPVSIQSACERVAATNQPEFVSSKSESGDQEAGFEAAVKIVQRAHSGYENTNPGDLGTMVVIARDDLITPLGLFPKGAKRVRNDKHWRQRIALRQFVRLD